MMRCWNSTFLWNMTFFDRLSGVKHLGHGSIAILFEITCQSTSTIVTHNSSMLVSITDIVFSIPNIVSYIFAIVHS